MVANEFLRDRLSNIQLLVGLYALVCFGFFTFFLPVMTGFMNAMVFLAGAGLTILVVWRVVHLIYWRNSAVPIVKPCWPARRHWPWSAY